jgi:hypothetical protein
VAARRTMRALVFTALHAVLPRQAIREDQIHKGLVNVSELEVEVRLNPLALDRQHYRVGEVSCGLNNGVQSTATDIYLPLLHYIKLLSDVFPGRELTLGIHLEARSL